MSAGRSPWRRLLAVVAVALLVPLAGCSEDEEPLRVGDVIGASGAPGEELGSSFVLVPTGRLDVTVGQPLATVTAAQTTDQAARTAPQGGRFVPVSMSFDLGPMDDVRTFLGEDAGAVVDLLVGDRAYRLPAPRDTEVTPVDHLFVAVDGDPRDIRLRVAFGEVSQVLDVRTGERSAGRAAPLYGRAKVEQRSVQCNTSVWPALLVATVNYQCRIGVPFRLPYAGGQWAPRGEQWLVVPMGVGLYGYGIPGERKRDIAVYEVLRGSDRTTLDGRRPVATVETTDFPGYYGQALVFRAPGSRPSRIDVEQRFVLRRDKVRGRVPDAPKRLQVDLGGPAPLPTSGEVFPPPEPKKGKGRGKGQPSEPPADLEAEPGAG